jgi:hypothetical protein
MSACTESCIHKNIAVLASPHQAASALLLLLLLQRPLAYSLDMYSTSMYNQDMHALFLVMNYPRSEVFDSCTEDENKRVGWLLVKHCRSRKQLIEFKQHLPMIPLRSHCTILSPAWQ